MPSLCLDLKSTFYRPPPHSDQWGNVRLLQGFLGQKPAAPFQLQQVCCLTHAQTHACMQAQARTYAHTNAVIGIKATVFACTCREWYRRNLSITFLMARVALHDLRKRVGPTKRRNTPATWSQTPVNHLLESHLIRYKRQRHCVHWLGITLGVLKRDRFQIKQSPQKKAGWWMCLKWWRI